jgi:nitrate reductase (NAD(P)H)
MFPPDCATGVVTDKTAAFIRTNSQAAAEEESQTPRSYHTFALQKHRWALDKHIGRKSVSEDTRAYIFHFPENTSDLELATWQHLQLGYHLQDKTLNRPCTPTKPLLPAAPKQIATMTLIASQTTQAPSNSPSKPTFLMLLSPATQLPISSTACPTGGILYNGNGCFAVSNNQHSFKAITFVLGGSGTALNRIARAMLSDNDDT